MKEYDFGYWILKVSPDQDPIPPVDEMDLQGKGYLTSRKVSLGSRGKPNEYADDLEGLKKRVKRLGGCFSELYPNYGMGLWVCFPEKDQTMEQCQKFCDAEAMMINQWINGDIYGFYLIDKATGDCIDSCWGFYGENPLENGMLSHFDKEVETEFRKKYEKDFVYSNGE